MEVAVFGIPDPRWGETPCAVVVPKSGRTIDMAEVVQLCAEQLGSYKKPGRVVVRDEPLPKTPVGKISAASCANHSGSGTRGASPAVERLGDAPAGPELCR